MLKKSSSNNTNKFNPQEQEDGLIKKEKVQIIQINSILKNPCIALSSLIPVQIIQINSILKNVSAALVVEGQFK